MSVSGNQEKWMGEVTPEEAGIPSGAVKAFLDRLDGRGIRMHSFMVLGNNQIAAEGYWAPFSRDMRHRMYSISKSVTSVAIGILIGEGKLSLEDKVAGYFTDKHPEGEHPEGGLHPWIAAATVRDLLMMATPFDATTYKSFPGEWVASFFQCKPSHPPGTLFNYDTSASHTLGALVERISGMKLIDFAREKFLGPIGFSKETIWLEDPWGVAQAGSGLYCTTHDLARFGLLCLNRGVYEETRYVPEEYMKTATAKHIETTVPGGTNITARAFKGRGYGYQFWCGTDDLFACYGMCGQFVIASPKRGMIVVTTADTQIDPGHEGNIVDAAWEELFQKASAGPLMANADAREALAEKLASLTMRVASGAADSPLSRELSGRKIILEENRMGISEVSLALSPEGGAFLYQKKSGSYRIDFGWGRHVGGHFPEGNWDCVASGGWVDERSLEIQVNILDKTPATLQILLNFKGDEVGLRMHRAVTDLLGDYAGFAGGTIQAE